MNTEERKRGSSRLQRSHIILLVMIATWATVLAAFALARHARINSTTYDLGIKAQVIWNTFRGDWFASSIEVSHYLGDHVQLIFLPLAPLYALWPDVQILLITQAIILALGAIPVFRIARRTLDSDALALIFSGVYLLYPLIGFVNRFDFHPVVFTIPFFLFAYDLLETDHPWWSSLFIILALSLREEVGLTVFAFGLYVALFMKRPRLGAAWAVGGLLWSLTAIFVIIPTFRGGPSDTVSRYGWLGETPGDMLRGLLTRPGDVFTHLWIDYRRLLVPKLLLPVGFLSLLAPLPLLAALPALAYNMLSATPSQSTIYFQYLAPVVPFVFIAAIGGARKIQCWSRGRRTNWALGGWLLLGVVLAWAWDNPFTATIDEPFFPVYALEQLTDAAAFHEAKALLPPEAPVATMMAYGPHLATRPEYHLFYDRLKLEHRRYGFPQIEYLLLNLSDLRWGVNARFFYGAIETAIGQYGYEAVYAKNDVALLQRDLPPQPATGAVLQRVIDLLEAGGKFAPTAPETLAWMGEQWLVEALPGGTNEATAAFGGGPRLVAYVAPEQRAPGQPLCPTLYWTTDEPLSADLTGFVHLVAPDGFVQAQRDSVPALGFAPVSSWQPGQIVADMHCLVVPPGLAPGTYTLVAGLYESASGARLPITASNLPITGDALVLGEVLVAAP